MSPHNQCLPSYPPKKTMPVLIDVRSTTGPWANIRNMRSRPRSLSAVSTIFFTVGYIRLYQVVFFFQKRLINRTLMYAWSILLFFNFTFTYTNKGVFFWLKLNINFCETFCQIPRILLCIIFFNFLPTLYDLCQL